MKNLTFLTGVMFVAALFALSSCSTEEKPMTPPPPAAAAPAAKAEAKAPPAEAKAEKAKTTKVAGDIGLLDMEKNYMILVTKEGKLVTIDFDPKTAPIERTLQPSKMADVGLGSSAVVQYQKVGDKLKATSLEYTPAKGE